MLPGGPALTRRLPAWAERWLANVALFFGLTVLCGLAVGVIASVLGPGTIEGQSSTINYFNEDGTLVRSDTPDDDPHIWPLFLMPLLIVAGSAFFGFPVALAWLGAAELACGLGASPKIVRRVGLVVIFLLGFVVLAGPGGALGFFAVVGMMAFVGLAKMPEQRSERPSFA